MVKKYNLLSCVLFFLSLSYGMAQNSGFITSETKTSPGDKDSVGKELLFQLFNNLDSTSREELFNLFENIKSNKKPYKEIISETGKFTVEVPNFYVEEKHSTMMDNGKEILSSSFVIQPEHEDHDNFAYIIGFKYLNDEELEQQVYILFDHLKEEILASTNSILEYEKNLTSFNYPVKEYLFNSEGGVKVRYWLIINNGIFYALSVITEESKNLNDLQERFFNSFKITQE